MNLDRQYSDCFWTASGELDCQSQQQAGSVAGGGQGDASLSNPDHSYHIPLTGTRYMTHSAPQINQNLGYIPRSCNLPTRVQPFRPKLTKFHLPRRAQINDYQTYFSRQQAAQSGFNYARPPPNCASCYRQADQSQYLPYGNTPSPVLDSEARYNFGQGLSGYEEPDAVPSGDNFGQYQNFQSVTPSQDGLSLVGGSIPQATSGLAAAMPPQSGGSYGSPMGSTPKEINSFSLIQFKAPALMGDLGKPDVVDTMLGGVAIWKERTLSNKYGGIFKRVELHDEKEPILNPIPMLANVRVSVKMNIKSNLFRDILDLFPNVWYDRQKRWLTVRTDTLDNALAILALICMINKGTVSIRQVRHYDLQRKYMMSLDVNSKHYNRYGRGALIGIIKKCALR